VTEIQPHAFVRRAIGLLLGLLAGALSLITSPASAQPKPVPTSTGTLSTADAAKSGWSRLAPAEREALRPLAASWDSLSSGQQRKWLAISKNYPTRAPVDQTRMHSRMKDWAALSGRERAEARLNYGITNELAGELSPEEKRARWQAYQQLSEGEKQKLSAQANARKLGAAPAARPVPPQKLATVPSALPLPRAAPSAPPQAPSSGKPPP
jgi:hypothetical protein